MSGWQQLKLARINASYILSFLPMNEVHMGVETSEVLISVRVATETLLFHLIFFCLG